MTTPYTLNVVDQSPVRRGGTASEALHETILLAQAVERWGYARYWVAEHHNSGGLAGTSPEILIGQIAAQTKTIRVGSGGVMLSHYSALKVAEQFRMLETFYPGRIDLGIGRAPGSDQLTAAALAYPKVPVDISHFPQQVVDLIGYLSNTMAEDHPFGKIAAQSGPAPSEMPDIWLLGSSDYSAQLAAALGVPFAFADFFGHTSDHGPMVVDIYRRQFKPSGYLKEPKLNVALQVVCADTEERAQFLASSRRVARVQSLTNPNRRSGMIPPEEASSYELNANELEVVGQNAKGFIIGDPNQVREGILASAERYGTTDITVVTNVFYFEERLRSFELVAKAMGIKPESDGHNGISN
jgi:luciferase family oxidoreductase group 1